MTTDATSQKTDKLVWIFLAIAVVFIYFFGLNIPLLGPDEPRYAQVAREMFERGDWITPTLGGFPWLEKPSLLYWLEIAAYKIFGVTEFAARLGSALFGLGTIFCLWTLGKCWTLTTSFNGHRKNNDFANWLALITASSIGMLAFSRGASFDIILTFPITASLLSFFIWEINREEAATDGTTEKKGFPKLSLPPAALISFYFFIGVALLAKGLIGIIFPLAIVGFYYFLSFKFPSRAFVFSLFWGTILSLLVASLWYVPMYRAHGWRFIDEFFVQHHFQRYTSNKYLHPQPFWFFWAVLPLMTIPWLPFFLASIGSLIKKIVRQRKAQSAGQSETLSNDRHSTLRNFALAWLLVPLFFFSLSGSKLPGYMLPALPAALILTADFVKRFAEKSRLRQTALKLLATAMFVFVFVILQFYSQSYGEHETVKHLIDTANAHGFADTRILTLHNTSHSAEFYAASRLERFPDGKQRYLYGVAEVKEFIEQTEIQPVLVLIPLEYLEELTGSDLVSSQILEDNGKLAMAVVNLK